MISSRQQAIRDYQDLIRLPDSDAQKARVIKALTLGDLFFLIYWVCGRREDIDKLPEYARDWIFDRCREVQAEPDGYLDLWAREHYKSTIITFGKTIQDVLEDPELTVGLFSFNRPTAKAFLRQIKREFEGNEVLRTLFLEVLWQDPHKEAPKWSEDDGIILKRKSNPKESTIEAWGLIDGQPVARHFRLMVYDDVVTKEHVTNPEMIGKVTQAWELSRNLTMEGGKTRYIGTRYHKVDTYKTIMDRKAAIPRLYPGTRDGQADGEPVMWSRETLADKRREMGSYVFACQILLDPKADEAQGFIEDWLRFWPAQHHDNLNIYLIGDPASKKKKSDYTAIMAIGLGADGNYYVVDMVRDRLNLKERADELFRMHRAYDPVGVGWEEYGLQADIEYFEERMDRENYHFDITPLGGPVAKEDRIRAMVPDYEEHRWYLPERCLKMNREGQLEDLTRVFINEEYNVFPFVSHDDMLDCKSRIKDEGLGAEFPMPQERTFVLPGQAPENRARFDPFDYV